MSGTYLYPLKRVFLNLSGGTVTGDTIFTQGVNATNLSGNTIYLSGVSLLNTFLQINAAISSATTIVQNGLNTYTGGTVLSPTINISAATLSYLSATTISGNTLFSGSTNLYNIFQVIGNASTQVQPGTNIQTGGTASLPIVSIIASPIFNNLFSSGSSQFNGVTAVSISGGTISGGTIYSGNTNLQNIFNSFNNQFETKANLSGATFTGAISASSITNTSLTSGRAIYAGSSGLLKTNSGFTYDDTSSLLFAQNMQIGSSSLSGTVTIWGDVSIMGQAISAFTSQLLIEDNNITLNYNPTASTTSTSLGAGFTIQDGSGISGTDAYFDLRGASSGVDNRSFATNLNDIRIRESGTTSSPNGARLLAEYDFLDAGFY